ncbi:SGNH/GDSL hydrolase family protein [Rossellomorea marisflavi]|uniref:SGNH/GDSL hydrolase family protein n=1 Tax=Rossellomorea marisflavi TaxID=189381 RepID=UPI00345C6F01
MMGYGNENSPFIKVDNKELKQKLDQDFNNLSQNFQTDINQFKQQTNTQLADRAKQSDLVVERKRIDSLASLPQGSTSGDAELIDVRVGADGKTYTNAGAAVRGQLTNVNKIFESALSAELAEYDFSRTLVTNSNIAGAITSGATPSQAYENGFSPTEEILVSGIKLNSNITTTTFSLFVFDSTLKLLQSVLNLSPTITNKEFTLASPLTVPAGGKLMIRFLNGSFNYLNTGVSNLKEYRPGVPSMVDTPLKAGFDVVYSVKAITFKKINIPSESKLSLSDYAMPKYKEIEGNYGFVGRWWEKDVSGTKYKATNNQGSQIFFKVSGVASINIGIQPITAPNNPYYYAYSIDGGAFSRKAISDTTIPLGDTKEHIVRVIIDGLGENDPVAGGKWYGSLGVYFTGVSVGSGTIKGILPANRKVIFTGDSITEGINVLTTGAIGSANSASKAYPMIMSNQLNAIPYYIGYGGTGVLGNASFHKAIEAIDYFYNNVASDSPNVDFIVMAHGFNDNTLITNGTYTVDQFKTAYNEVLDRLKVKFTGVPIVCVVPFGAQALKPHIESCIVGRSYCYLVNTNGWSITTTDNVHPDVNGSKLLGENIAKAVVPIFGKQFFMN